MQIHHAPVKRFFMNFETYVTEMFIHRAASVRGVMFRMCEMFFHEWRKLSKG